MPRLSANLGLLWPDRPLLARLDAAARAGFGAVEFHFPYEVPASELRARCARLGLRVLGLNTPPGDRTRGEFGLGAVPGREEDFQAGFDLALTYASSLGARAIHCMAGFVTPEGPASAAACLERNLRHALRKLEGVDVCLLLEPLNARDQPGYFYSKIDAALAMIERIGDPRLRLQFDAYHVAMADEDPVRRLREVFRSVGHVQIAGVPGRHEPDGGNLDPAALFSALDALGYRGWVGCEYHPRTSTEAGLSWARPWLERSHDHD